MKKNPLISVLVPVYNIERYIGLCLESIICQTYINLEVIVVDDGSTDRSGEICDLYAKKDSRIRVIHKQNGGLVSARKTAMKLAAGDYIGYVDGDDWIGEGFYSALLPSLQQTNIEFNIGANNSNITNLKFHNTQVVTTSASNITFDNINVTVDQGVGMYTGYFARLKTYSTSESS